MLPDSLPASRTDIAVALGVLFKAMPPARGVAVSDRLEGYLVALAEFPLPAIEAGIARFLAGKCEGVKTAFCPHPPELAAIVRGAAPARDGPPLQVKSPPVPLGETLFQRQWRRWKAGEIGHIGDGLHGAPLRRRMKPDEDVRARYGMTDAALAGMDPSTGRPAEERRDEDFGGLA